VAGRDPTSARRPRVEACQREDPTKPSRIVLLTLLALAASLESCASRDRVPSKRIGSRLVVLNKADCTLAIVEPDTGWTKDLVPTGIGPHEVAVARDGSIAVVANYGEKTPGQTLTVYDLRERRVIDTIDLSPHQRPHGIAFLDNRSTLLVTSETSRAVLEVSVPGRRVVRAMDTGAAGSHMLALSGDRKRVYTANLGSGSVSEIDLDTGKLVSQAPTGRETEAIALSPDGRELWVGNRAEDTLTLLHPRGLEKLASIPCAKMPIRLKFTRDGARVLVSCAQSNDVAVIDTATRAEVGRIPMPFGDAEPREKPPPPVPVGLLIEPANRFAFIACSNARKIAVVDLATLQVTSEIQTGNVPDGMGWALGNAATGRSGDANQDPNAW
jgi:YVTN family beta-propeller protein